MSLLYSADFQGEGYLADTLSVGSADNPLREDVVAPSAQLVRQEISLAMAADEATETVSRIYTPEEIERGVLGQHHPVTGNCLIGTVFDPEKGALVMEHHESGWGSTTVKREPLPRIGDGSSHSEKDFPLPHWNFDPRTRESLRKSK